MKLFTVGPTQMSQRTLEVAGRQVPYFRNQTFSDVVFDCEQLLLEFTGAVQGSRVVLLTASGTGAMEATVMNCLGEQDKALVINGGSFGRRFSQLCDVHGVPHDDVELDFGTELTAEHLNRFDGQGHTALLVNLDETSNGQLYDLDMLAHYCKRNDMLLVVDAISAFASDPIDMEKAGVDALIVSSQKALALAPGISVVVLSPRMLDRIETIDPHSMYFDFKDYLKNGERGQTPFTPAVGIIYELQDRLHAIAEAGGIDAEIARVEALAQDFRQRIADLPLSMPSYRKSNAVTLLLFDEPVAQDVLSKLENDYGFVLNPCGGELADTAARVAHIGDLTISDNAALVEALKALLS